MASREHWKRGPELGGCWLSKLHIGLNHITPAMIRAFVAKRQVAGVSGRTVNLAIVILHDVLKRGSEGGWLRRFR